MSLFILQTVQKFGEDVGDALIHSLPFLDIKESLGKREKESDKGERGKSRERKTKIERYSNRVYLYGYYSNINIWEILKNALRVLVYKLFIEIFYLKMIK